MTTSKKVKLDVHGPCARPSCPGQARGYNFDGSHRTYCSAICRHLMIMATTVDSALAMAEARGTWPAEYSEALRRDAEALDAVYAAWSDAIRWWRTAGKIKASRLAEPDTPTATRPCAAGPLP